MLTSIILSKIALSKYKPVKKIPYFPSLKEITPGPSDTECWIFLKVIIPLGKSAMVELYELGKQNANEKYLIFWFQIRHFSPETVVFIMD